MIHATLTADVLVASGTDVDALAERLRAMLNDADVFPEVSEVLGTLALGS